MSTDSLDVIVAGAGRVGVGTARNLAGYGHSVTVVERDRQRCETVSDEYIATIIEGDATRPDLLRQADPTEADVIAALTGNQGANLGICVSAMQMTDEIRTVARVEDEGAESYREIVDEVVFPETLGAAGATNAVIGGDVRAFEEVVGDLRFLQVRVREEAPVAGKPLSEISMPRGAIVVSDESTDRVADSETVLRANESYVVATEPDVTDEILNLFQG